MELEIQLNLTVSEVNTILRTLGTLPFNEITDLIHRIKKQGDEAIEKIQSADTEVEEDK